jgi:hypothetical protein
MTISYGIVNRLLGWLHRTTVDTAVVMLHHIHLVRSQGRTSYYHRNMNIDCQKVHIMVFLDVTCVYDTSTYPLQQSPVLSSHWFNCDQIRGSEFLNCVFQILEHDPYDCDLAFTFVEPD